MDHKFRILEDISSSLVSHGLKLVLAESMTGGALASIICREKHAGDYFLGSIVCYSDEMKQSALAIDSSLIETFGGVSAEVTAAMVRGLQTNFPMADLLVGITGFAFECPATSRENPVGTVFIHIHLERVHFTKRYILEGDENSIIDQAVNLTLELMNEIIQRLVEGSKNG